jgi:uncharacterized protein (DUF433 family)
MPEPSRKPYICHQKQGKNMDFKPLLNRITIDPAICHGKPVVRGLRYPVESILEYLAAGDSTDDILHEFDDLELDDILACLAYAAYSIKTKSVVVSGKWKVLLRMPGFTSSVMWALPGTSPRGLSTRTMSPSAMPLSRRVLGVDEQHVFGDDLHVAGAAGHGAAVVVLQHAVGGDDVGVVLRVGRGFGVSTNSRKMNLPLPRLKVSVCRILVSVPSGATGHCLPLLAEFVPAHAGEETARCRLISSSMPLAVVRRCRLRVADSGSSFPRGSGRRALQSPMGSTTALHALDAALAVGEGAFFFQERRAGQHHVGQFGGFGHKNSCTTSSRAFSTALATWLVFGSLCTMSSPMTQRALSLPASAASYISGMV